MRKEGENRLYNAEDNNTGLSLVSAVSIKLRILLGRSKQVILKLSKSNVETISKGFVRC